MEGEHVVYSFSLWPQLQFLRKLLIYELVLVSVIWVKNLERASPFWDEQGISASVSTLSVWYVYVYRCAWKCAILRVRETSLESFQMESRLH